MGGSCDGGPPLRIVLGAFGGSPSSARSPKDGDANATTAQADGTPPAAYILGTSYFATPRLGTSPSGGSRSVVLRLDRDGRVPMEDRKGPLDHFSSKALVLSTVRTTAISVSTTISNYFHDQMANEQRLDSMVDSGDITSREADEMNEEWEEREWKVRMDGLPRKIGRAILRFHACTAVMRLYEFVAARFVLRVDAIGGSPYLSRERAVTTMDRLTRDPFRASLRTSQLLKSREHSPGRVVSSGGTETPTSRELARRMFSTCVWANVIPFLAELTVQQGVLVYGYAMNYKARRERQMRRKAAEEEEGDGKGKGGQCDEGDEDDIDESAYALSLMFSSSRLSIARGMSWIAASAGGAAGSAVYPGWGAVFGIQIGDAVVGALID